MQELVRRKWWQEWNSEVHVKDSSAQLKISMDKSVYSLKAIWMLRRWGPTPLNPNGDGMR